MYIRDLVLNGDLPTLEQLTYLYGFIAYPLGGQIHKYLGERFGYGRVADLYDDLWKYSGFERHSSGPTASRWNNWIANGATSCSENTIPSIPTEARWPSMRRR